MPHGSTTRLPLAYTPTSIIWPQCPLKSTVPFIVLESGGITQVFTQTFVADGATTAD